MKIHPVGAKFFYADGATNTTNDEADSHFSNFFFNEAPHPHPRTPPKELMTSVKV